MEGLLLDDVSLCADNQFRMSILERLEQMERRMAEMAACDGNQQLHHQHQHGSQLATPPPPPDDHQQVRMLPDTHTYRNLPGTQGRSRPGSAPSDVMAHVTELK